MSNLDIKKYIQEIIQKKFTKKDKGYDPTEVDKTLDDIFQNFSHYIDDYNSLSKKYDELEEKFGNLSTQYEVIEKQNKMYMSEIQRYESSGASMNLLKSKMDRLENELRSKEPKESKTKKVNQ